MNIDWSEAPEGATHYFVGAASGEWRDLSGKTWEYWHKGACFNSGLSSSHLLTYPGDMIAGQRPPLEWTGEGLPPVGTVCEYQRNDVSYRQEWVKVTPKYFGKEMVVLEHSASGEEYVEQAASCVFRPIRTPEQIAEEERRSEFYKACEEINSNVNFTNEPLRGSILAAVVLAMIDAGYRKQEQTK